MKLSGGQEFLDQAGFFEGSEDKVNKKPSPGAANGGICRQRGLARLQSFFQRHGGL